jgi:hypothetical protein
MIFDKLFGKKHNIQEEKQEFSELNKIKKVVYNKPQSNNLLNNNFSVPSNTANSNLPLNNGFPSPTNNILKVDNNNFNNNGKKEVVNPLVNNNPISQQSLISNSPSNLPNNIQHSNVLGHVNNQPTPSVPSSDSVNALPLQNAENNIISNNSNMFNNNLSSHTSVSNDSDNHFDLSSVKLEDELEKSLADIEKQLNSLVNEVNSPTTQPTTQVSTTEPAKIKPSSDNITKKGITVTSPEKTKDVLVPEGALVLNQEEKKEEEKPKIILKEGEEKKEEKKDDEESSIFIRLDKYEETLKIIETIKKKIEENELLLEKIVELKKEEDIKLEKWKEELTRINRELIKIYTTLKNT